MVKHKENKHLKRVMEFDYKWVLHLLEDILLGFRVHDLLPLNDGRFAQYFHGINFSRRLHPHEQNLAKAALADNLEHLEVVHRDLFTLLLRKQHFLFVLVGFFLFVLLMMVVMSVVLFFLFH